MQLWIRTKEGLFNVNGVRINAQSLVFEGKTDIVSDTGFLLGTYKTRERALKIIDEIQKCLEHSDYMMYSNASAKEPSIRANRDLFVLCDDNMCQIQERPLIIYTMPKE